MPQDDLSSYPSVMASFQPGRAEGKTGPMPTVLARIPVVEVAPCRGLTAVPCPAAGDGPDAAGGLRADAAAGDRAGAEGRYRSHTAKGDRPHAAG